MSPLFLQFFLSLTGRKRRRGEPSAAVPDSSLNKFISSPEGDDDSTLKERRSGALDLSLEDFFSLPEGDDGPPLKERRAGLEGYNDQKALEILNDFLQPASCMCLETAVTSIIDLLPKKKSSFKNDALCLANLCYEVALHIPWDHSSLLKLAWLVERVGWCPKLTNFALIKGPADTHQRHWFFESVLREAWDNAQRVDPEDGPKKLQELVDFSAFMASLEALNVWSNESPFIAMTLDPVFEKPSARSEYTWHPNAPEVERSYRDCWIMAAAQWILWDGQNLYCRALYQGPPEGSNLSDSVFVDGANTPVTKERWTTWKQGFKDVCGEAGISQECRDITRGHIP